MKKESPAAHGSALSVLSLEFDVLDENPDWPVVRILVDGEDPWAANAPDWRGFDPGKMLGPASPLQPDDIGRRVALYCCSCGEPGCGVIAPLIVPSPDGRRVSWVDFRNYTGVFVNPLDYEDDDDPDQYDGTSWNFSDLHFDRAQYVAEVERLARDTSWETPARQTARLLHERLKALGVELPGGFEFRWAAPLGNERGVYLDFHRDREGEFDQQVLRMVTPHEDPETAAEALAEQLLSTPPSKRIKKFGWDGR